MSDSTIPTLIVEQKDTKSKKQAKKEAKKQAKKETTNHADTEAKPITDNTDTASLTTGDKLTDEFQPKLKSETNRVASAIRANNVQYYVAVVDLSDDQLSMNECAKSIKRLINDKQCAFMLISAGTKNINITIDIPINGYDQLMNSWIQKAMPSEVVSPFDVMIIAQNDESYESTRSYSLVAIDSPHKAVDQVRSNAFQFLRSCGKYEEDSEEDFVLPMD